MSCQTSTQPAAAAAAASAALGTLDLLSSAESGAFMSCDTDFGSFGSSSIGAPATVGTSTSLTSVDFAAAGTDSGNANTGVPLTHQPRLASPPCAGCGQRITERFLLQLNEELWHERCVKCSVCQRELSGKCFSRHGRLYCEEDFFL